MKKVMRVVRYIVPAGRKVSGHLLRITAFSQNCILSWSDARMRVRFHWKSIEEMAYAYLDHRVRASSTSHVFFSPRIPEPVSRA